MIKIRPTFNRATIQSLVKPVAYPLIDGCHSWAHAGTAIFNWNFDARGKSVGTSYRE
jgi:hypothetical protein